MNNVTLTTIFLRILSSYSRNYVKAGDNVAPRAFVTRRNMLRT